jgi:hypothetical protein
MGQLAHPDVRWRPAAIRHRHRERIVSVLAQVEHGVAASQVIRALRSRLADVDLPAGVELHYGGEAEGSAGANTAMLKTVPLGVLLLLVFLMAEFNSFHRVTIITSTVPLAVHASTRANASPSTYTLITALIFREPEAGASREARTVYPGHDAATASGGVVFADTRVWCRRYEHHNDDHELGRNRDERWPVGDVRRHDDLVDGR